METLQQRLGWSPITSYRAVFFAYATVGGTMAIIYAFWLPATVEVSPASLAIASPPTGAALAPGRGAVNGGPHDDLAATAAAAGQPACGVAAWWRLWSWLGLRRASSVFIVARLAALFALDAFAGAFVMQTWLAFFFASRYGFPTSLLGTLLMAANVVSGLSSVAAAALVKRFGAINTMIWTHLPSNVLLLGVPLLPWPAGAAALLVARFTISQMDVPARQAYVAMVVASDERSAAGGITNIARSVGMALAPLLLGVLSAAPHNSAVFAAPFFIAGGLKIVYDLSLAALYHCGAGLKLNERKAAAAAAA